MEIDFEFSTEMMLLLGQVLMAHTLTLLLHALIGFVLGTVVVFILWRMIRKYGGFQRNFESSLTRVGVKILHVLFYGSIIAMSVTVSLHLGSVKIVDHEVQRGVDYGLKYCREVYFEDEELIQEVFDAAQTVYASGGEVSEMNEAIAQGMVDAISEKYGLGFMGDGLLGGAKSEMVTQLESIEKAIIFISVSKSLEYIGQDDLVEPDQLENAFNQWIHSDYEKTSQDVSSFIRIQIVDQIKPLITSIWLPFYLVSGFVMLLTVVEVGVYYWKGE